MENNKSNNLIEALKEYNKSLSEQISRIKAFIEDIDKQLAHHQKVEKEINEKRVSTPFSKHYLMRKVQQNFN